MQPQAIQTDTFNPQGKKILFISAHPDDADFGAAGTALKWLNQGAKGAIVIATNGDKGSEDHSLTSEQLKQIRHAEQLAASKMLRLEETWFLDYPDAHLEIGQSLKEQLVKIIREYRPDIVFTFDPTMVYSLVRGTINHPDHRAIGQAALDAIFPMSRDILTFPHHKNEHGLEPHKVSDIFLYNFDKPTYFTDITELIDEKIEVIKTHKSQIDSSVISDRVREWNAIRGSMIGVKYAEAFVHIHLN